LGDELTKFENELTYGDTSFYYCDLRKVFEQYPKLKKLPNILKLLLEMNLRNHQESSIEDIIEAFLKRNNEFELNITPTRLLMDDINGIPPLMEFTLIKEHLYSKNNDVSNFNPQIMIDLIVDHSLIAQSVATNHSLNTNLKIEMDTNKQKYHFLKWVSQNFENINIVTPGFGIGHQINLEHLATMISIEEFNGKQYMIPESLLGTDVHTNMISSLGVLSYSIEETDCLTSMLGAPVHITLPKVLGIEIIGNKENYLNVTDIVLNLTNFLIESKLNYDFVEFFGDGVKLLSLEDRATITNMSNEYNVKCAYFSVDEETINYAEKTRNVDASLIKDYYKRQALYFKEDIQLEYDEIIQFDLSQVKAAIAGPKYPFAKVNLEKVPSKLESFKRGNILRDNDIVLASITSCLSTSNPFLIIQAGLLAKNAISKGLSVNPNIKTSFIPGSRTVKKYLEQIGLLVYFEKLGFSINGYGCAVCYGNSGDLFTNVENEIKQYNLNLSSVSSGNRNQEGFIHPLIKSNWIMSPALVIAYCLKGSVNFNIKSDLISKGTYLNDIWPSDIEVNKLVNQINYKEFSKKYMNIFLGETHWQEIDTDESILYQWNKNSLIINPINHIKDIYLTKVNLNYSSIISILGDDVRGEDIMPMGKITKDSNAGKYLLSLNVHEDNLGTYESRKTNYDVLVKSVFSSVNIKNLIIQKEGAFTKDFINDETIELEEFANKSKASDTPILIFTGKNFGIGKNLDAAAKAMKLLGIDVVICESINESFRKSLIDFGIFPLKLENQSLESLNLLGDEKIYVYSLNLIPNEKLQIEITQNNKMKKVLVSSLLKTNNEIIYFKNGGKTSYLMKNLIQ